MSVTEPWDQHNTPEFLSRLVETVENDVAPLTEAGVKAGNKVFGAAILRKENLSLVVAGTNLETEWPLLHGEMSCLRNLQGMQPPARPASNKECVFISTHEPCSLCLSAITWSGFDNFYYLFSYEDTKDAFNIPHDLKILDEVFDCKDGAYQRENHFWKAFGIEALIKALPDGAEKDGLQKRILALRERYNGFSQVYQDSKGDNNIPLS